MPWVRRAQLKLPRSLADRHWQALLPRSGEFLRLFELLSRQLPRPMTRFMIRRLEETGAAPLGNLVKGSDRHLVAEGDQLLGEIEEQGRRACDAAVEQGRRDGEAEGRKRAAALMSDTVAAAQGQLRASEKRLIAIVMEAVRRIIGEFDDTELTSRLVRKLVAEAESEGRDSPPGLSRSVDGGSGLCAPDAGPAPVGWSWWRWSRTCPWKIVPAAWKPSSVSWRRVSTRNWKSSRPHSRNISWSRRSHDPVAAASGGIRRPQRHRRVQHGRRGKVPSPRR